MKENFPRYPNISLDYGVLEKSDNVYVMNEGELIAGGDAVSIFNNAEVLQRAGIVMPKLARLFGHKNPAPRSVEDALNLL